MLQGLKLAVRGISSHKLRSFLTVLGVIIGIVSVIILTGIMQGMKQEVISSYEKLGMSVIEVNIYDQHSALEESDIISFVDNNKMIIGGYSPALDLLEKSIEYNSKSQKTTVKGVHTGYQTIKNLEIIEGRFLSYLDIINHENVCVIGSYPSESLFNNYDVIGQEIKIEGEYYRVIGVIEERSDNEKGSEDDIVIIPYLNAQRLSKNGRINNVYFKVYSNDLITEAISRIDRLLNDKVVDEEYYSIYSMNTMVENLQNMLDKFSIALLGVASISLLVGGIGIMNIMFVNIMERRKEIGIRLAVGATPRNIHLQFLIEAITLSCLGGLLGIGIGIVILYYAVKIIGITFVVSYTAIAFAFLISGVIGITFGSLPARKASRIDPIDSLRL